MNTKNAMNKGIEMIIQEAIASKPKITIKTIEQRLTEMSNQEIIEKFMYNYEDIPKQTYKDAIKEAFEKTGMQSKTGIMLSTTMFFRWADNAYANEYMTDEEYEVAKNQVKMTARILARCIDTTPLRQYEINKVKGELQ